MKPLFALFALCVSVAVLAQSAGNTTGTDAKQSTGQPSSGGSDAGVDAGVKGGHRMKPLATPAPGTAGAPATPDTK
jgi:hypothetical protein